VKVLNLGLYPTQKTMEKLEERERKMCFWKMPKRHSFSLPKQAHPFTPKKPFTEFNSIPKMSLLQSFPSPNLLLLLSLPPSLSLRNVSLRRHIWKQLVHAKNCISLLWAINCR